MTSPTRATVWVLGDQLNRDIGALRDATPATHRVLMVESRAKLTGKRWHRQRAHFVLASMRRFADELRAAGFEVDYRKADSLRRGYDEHVAAFGPVDVVATEPASWDGLELLRALGVATVRSNQFLCHYDDFADWAGGRKQLKMEDFYRWQRRRLGYLMEGDEPVTGRWNYDDENRQRPPKTETRRGRNRSSHDSTSSTERCLPTFPTAAGAPTPTARGRRHVMGRSLACVTSSTRCSRCSDRTRTRWSNGRGISPTRCCRRT